MENFTGWNATDLIANAMPWAASLVPASMTIANTQKRLEFGVVEAWIAGGVVEGLGFVSVTTTLELFELYQAETEPTQKAVRLNQFWVALGGTGFYVAVVIVLNALMDSGDWQRKLVLGFLSTFAVVGALMVALRNQMYKRLAQIAAAKKAGEDTQQQMAEAAQKEKERLEEETRQERLRQDEAQRQERAQRAEERRLDRQAERDARLAEKRIELEMLLAGNSSPSQKVAEPVAENGNKSQRWSALSDSKKQRVIEIVRNSQLEHGKAWKKPAVAVLMAESALEERQAYKWLEYAERDAEAQNG